MKSTPAKIMFLMGLAFVPPLHALQTSPKPAPGTAQPAASEKVPEDPLGRSTPHGTLEGFLKAADHDDYEGAAQYLDSKLRPQQKQELARQLKLVMDRGLSVNLDTLSRDTEGNTQEGKLPITRELVGVAKVGSKSLDILLDHIQRGKNPPIWLFSAETLVGVPEMAEEIQPLWVERHAKTLVEKRLFSIPFYRWIGGLITIPLFLVVSWLVSRLLAFALRRIFPRLTEEGGLLSQAHLAGPVRLLILVLLIYLMSRLGYSLAGRQFWTRVATVLGILALVWLALRLTDAVSGLMGRRFRQSNLPGRIAVVQLAGGLSKALALTAGLLLILYLAGFNLSAVLTGLGVGGLAVAFAAQKTLENLFGTVMIVSDRVVRVGDFCRIGDSVGTIEDVGLRSTRVRTNARTIVSIPNGQLASMSLENFSARDQILFNPTIGLRYETSADQLRFILAETRRLLYEHPRVASQTPRVRFVKFGGSSLDLEVFAYVRTSDFNAFLEIQEDLLLRIMDIIEAGGSGFAFSQMSFIGKARSLDAEKGQAAIAEVGRWRQERQLPFPDFRPEQIAELQDRIEYPPPESALRNRHV